MVLLPANVMHGVVTCWCNAWCCYLLVLSLQLRQSLCEVSPQFVELWQSVQQQPLLQQPHVTELRLHTTTTLTLLVTPVHTAGHEGKSLHEHVLKVCGLLLKPESLSFWINQNQENCIYPGLKLCFVIKG